LQRFHLIDPAEIHMDTRDPVDSTEVAQRLRELPDPPWAVFPGCDQEPAPPDRCEGDPCQQLGVVGDARPFGGLRPAVVENEFSLTVQLDIQRTGRDDTILFANHEGPRYPACLRAYAPGHFE